MGEFANSSFLKFFCLLFCISCLSLSLRSHLLNIGIFSYNESPLQPLSQSINPSTNQPNTVPTNIVEFDYPLLVESILNAEDLSSETATRRHDETE